MALFTDVCYTWNDSATYKYDCSDSGIWAIKAWNNSDCSGSPDGTGELNDCWTCGAQTMAVQVVFTVVVGALWSTV